ncbi:MarR family winged helix-turn-helix transcriptional regulator [Leifsonia sp. AG29]|uniref:MarR family winged helix-turn-helix transcriptional regulator n=1 Tax=Leifsonia sp. AG29 TaxID=2598860 RepID=UPI00131A828D|nr:MarR family winged helix-turn-helix transcriptional regulator [Leifsonia sp. AG29]
MGLPDRDDTIGRIQRELLTIGRRGTARVRRENEALSVVDRSLLSFIDENPGCRAIDIAAHFQLNRSTVSRQLGALFEHGYVATTDGGTVGGRGVGLRLTAEGSIALERSTRSIQASVEHRLQRWSEADLDVFARMLERYNSGDEATGPQGE